MKSLGTIGEDLLKRVKERAEFSKRNARAVHQILRLDEYLSLDFPPKKWLVDNLIGQQELVLLTGAAKTGKSLLTLNIGIAVSEGLPFLGEVAQEPQTVLIVQTELSKQEYFGRLKSTLIQLIQTIRLKSYSPHAQIENLAKPSLKPL